MPLRLLRNAFDVTHKHTRTHAHIKKTITKTIGKDFCATHKSNK